jgi:S-DNA-T family DNA segregation ATPase FtsK/SpoIIIE
MPSDDDYGALGLEPRGTRGIKLSPGRGWTSRTLEFQAATVAGDPSEPGQSAAIKRLAETLTAGGDGRKAPPVGRLPALVVREELPAGERPLTAVVGLGDSSLLPYAIDLTQRHFLVAGPYHSGRSTALRTIAEGVRAATPSLELHLLAPRTSPLPTLDIWMSVAIGAEECVARAAELEGAVAGREPGQGPMVIVIDDGDELTDGPAGLAVESIIRRGRDRAVRVVAAAERAGARAFSGWPRELRRDEHGLLLQPDDTDSGLLNSPLPRRPNVPFPPGRGYVVSRGTVELVQIATDPANQG